jgi:hypothetical protein
MNMHVVCFKTSELCVCIKVLTGECSNINMVDYILLECLEWKVVRASYNEKKSIYISS